MPPPLPLERFSPRARRRLAAATRHEVERDPEVIAVRLRAAGRPVFAAAVEFERLFGGLVWGQDALGVDYDEPLIDETDVLMLEETQVPIGWVGVCGLYMNEAGEVTTQPNNKSSSIQSFLEQYAIESSPVRYQVKLRPAPGAPLATMLGLDPVRGATDAYQDWWESGAVVMRHVRQREAYESRADAVSVPSLDEVFPILEAARRLDPSVRVSVWGWGGPGEVRYTAEEAARSPSMDSWGSHPGVVRFGYGDEDTRLRGVVWVFPDERRIEQYVDAHNGGEWHRWVSYGEVDTVRSR